MTFYSPIFRFFLLFFFSVLCVAVCFRTCSAFVSFVAWSRPSETLVLSRKATTSQVRFMRIAIRLLTNQAEETTRVQKVHSRILLYLSYSGCSRKADLRTIAIGLVWIVSYSAFFRYSEIRQILEIWDFQENRGFFKKG